MYSNFKSDWLASANPYRNDGDFSTTDDPYSTNNNSWNPYQLGVQNVDPLGMGNNGTDYGNMGFGGLGSGDMSGDMGSTDHTCNGDNTGSNGQEVDNSNNPILLNEIPEPIYNPEIYAPDGSHDQDVDFGSGEANN